jgi:hypothetical protein
MRLRRRIIILEAGIFIILEAGIFTILEAVIFLILEAGMFTILEADMIDCRLIRLSLNLTFHDNRTTHNNDLSFHKVGNACITGWSTRQVKLSR